MRTGIAGRGGRALGLAAVFAGLALGLVAAVGPPRLATAAQKDEKKEPPRPEPGQKKAHALLGASGCKTCHSETKPEDKEEYQQTKAFEFVRLSENEVWGKHDLHSTAYRSLVTDRTPGNKKFKPNATAQRMEDRLRQYKGEAYYVATDTACLACHASAKRPLSAEPVAAWKAASFATNEGVGCEMCHGHGSMYAERHKTNRDAEEGDKTAAEKVVDWRLFPAAVKREWGMIDLRDPATAAQTCASCHIGNKGDGRFVTHDMFAAGHPPLPPLDLLAYAREQPRHWGFADDMPYIVNLAKKSDTAEKAFALYRVREAESFVARRFAESAVATLGATAALGAQLAEEAHAKNDGLDFSAFDCYSCHHDLKYPSERQARGFVGRPGRPLYRPAAFALARLVLGHAGTMDNGKDLKGAAGELDKLELELADAFTAKTYGDPEKVKAATEKLAAWTVAARKKLEAVRYTPDQVVKLLEKVVAAGADEKKRVGDPEVAQLYTWAVETLYLDRYPPSDAEVKAKKGPAALLALTGAIQGSVVARLRPKTPFYYEQGVDKPFDGTTNDKDSVEGRIKDRMDVFNAFVGAPFRKAFGGLEIPPPKK